MNTHTGMHWQMKAALTLGGIILALMEAFWICMVAWAFREGEWGGMVPALGFALLIPAAVLGVIGIERDFSRKGK